MVFIRSSFLALLLACAASTEAFSIAKSPVQLGARTAAAPGTKLNGAAESIGNDFGGAMFKIAAESSVSIPGVTDLVGAGNESLVLGGAAFAVLALAAAAVTSSSGSKTEEKTVEEPESEPEPIDVSIPYDAAAILAYKEWRQEEPDLKSELFAAFKALYLEKAVAEVTMKQKARNFEKLTSSA